MMTAHRRWLQYWQTKSTPLHREESESFYRVHAAELRGLFQGEPRSVLEIGCGNGALYDHLGFNDATYVGVDFSDSMLREFKSSHPSLTLHQADGSSYRDGQTYDLIFSNGTVQYFDHRMLDNHMEAARAMMHAGSVFICGSVPWRRNRLAFYGGGLTPPYGLSQIRSLRSIAFRLLRGFDPLGYWYDLAEMARFGSRHGFSASFFGSASYLYRFHAVFRLAVPAR
jgi:cyclopropane fatty-acyl-phospholipid synthase-like methyltransferase